MNIDVHWSPNWRALVFTRRYQLFISVGTGSWGNISPSAMSRLVAELEHRTPLPPSPPQPARGELAPHTGSKCGTTVALSVDNRAVSISPSSNENWNWLLLLEEECHALFSILMYWAIEIYFLDSEHLWEHCAFYLIQPSLRDALWKLLPTSNFEERKILFWK